MAPPVRAQAVEAIRDEIIRGNLLPGQRLVERELCEQLDVSRNTIREACRQLEAEGFIEIPPHKGPVVSTISDRDARDLYEFREALECLAVRLFVERATQDAINDLHDSCTTLFAAHDSLDVAAMIDAKNHFYEIIYAGTENKVVGAQAKLLNGRLAGLRAQSLSQPGRLPGARTKSKTFCSRSKRATPPPRRTCGVNTSAMLRARRSTIHRPPPLIHFDLLWDNRLTGRRPPTSMCSWPQPRPSVHLDPTH